MWLWVWVWMSVGVYNRWRYVAICTKGRKGVRGSGEWRGGVVGRVRGGGGGGGGGGIGW